MPHLNVLGCSIESGATRSRDVVLTIDGRRFTDLLEESVRATVGIGRWAEKEDARVVTQALKKSISRPGTYSLLTCAHCGMPEDLMLKPIEVTHGLDTISWRVSPPGADLVSSSAPAPLLELHFDRQQYERAVAKVMQREPTDV